MKLFNSYNTLLALLISFSCLSIQAEESAAPDPVLRSDMGYFYGFSFGNMLKDGGSDDVDIESLIKGLNDSLEGSEPALNGEQRERVYQEVRARQLRVQAERQVEQEALQKAAEAQSEMDLVKAEAFLAENALRENVKVTPSGLQYEIVHSAGGDHPSASSRVVVNYVGSFLDGGIFDQSTEPVEFGLQQVISGWTEGLQLMGVGDRMKLYLHPKLAYGAGSVGDIPPNSLLVFDIELLEIK